MNKLHLVLEDFSDELSDKILSSEIFNHEALRTENVELIITKYIGDLELRPTILALIMQESLKQFISDKELIIYLNEYNDLYAVGVKYLDDISNLILVFSKDKDGAISNCTIFLEGDISLLHKVDYISKLIHLMTKTKGVNKTIFEYQRQDMYREWHETDYDYAFSRANILFKYFMRFIIEHVLVNGKPLGKFEDNKWSFENKKIQGFHDGLLVQSETKYAELLAFLNKVADISAYR